MWSVLPKTQRLVVTLHYSPCDDTSNAAIVALTASGVSLLICKTILFVSILPFAVHGCRDTLPVVTAMVAAGEYHHMGCRTKSQHTSEF
jgi:hypothetical protein